MVRAIVMTLSLIGMPSVAVTDDIYSRGDRHAKPLKIIFKGERTIDAAPYYRRITLKEKEYQQATQYRSAAKSLNPLRAEPVSLQEWFPIKTPSMHPGEPVRYESNHLYRPFFILGMDDYSVGWLRQHFHQLAAMQAYGVVVQASDWNAWLQMKAEALRQGITLVVMSGESLSKMYGISRYPALILDKGYGRQAVDEPSR